MVAGMPGMRHKTGGGRELTVRNKLARDFGLSWRKVEEGKVISAQNQEDFCLWLWENHFDTPIVR